MIQINASEMLVAPRMLDAHPPNALACQMDWGCGSHGQSVKGTEEEVKRPQGSLTRSCLRIFCQEFPITIVIMLMAGAKWGR